MILQGTLRDFSPQILSTWWFRDIKGAVKGTFTNVFKYSCLLKMMFDEVGLRDVVYVCTTYRVFAIVIYLHCGLNSINPIFEFV